MAVCTMLHLEDGWYIEQWTSYFLSYPSSECFLVHECSKEMPQPYHSDVTIRGYGTVSAPDDTDKFVCMACKMEAPEHCYGYLNLCRSIRNMT